MIDYKDKPASFYFTETDLKKILLEVSSQPMVIMPLKRKALIRELGQVKDKVVGKHITEQQFEYLQLKKAKNTEPEYLNYDDVDLINNYFAKYPKSKIKKVQLDIINSLIKGSFRVQEICDYDGKQLDKENARIRILGKGKKWRWTYVDDDFITFLLGFKARHNVEQNAIFKNSYGEDYQPFFVNSQSKPFTPRNIQKFMDNISVKLPKLSHKLHPHLFRHTYAVFRILKNPTLSPEELRQDMGHESIRDTQIYFRLAEAERIKLNKRRNENTNINKKEEQQNKSIFCKACGKNIDSDSKFCRYCGEKQ